MILFLISNSSLSQKIYITKRFVKPHEAINKNLLYRIFRNVQRRVLVTKEHPPKNQFMYVVVWIVIN